MRDFEDKMNRYLDDDGDYGANGMPYTMEGRILSDMDMKLLHKLNIPLIRHLAGNMDYQGLGTYICGVINQQEMDHD